MFKAYYYEFLGQAFIVRAVTDYLSYYLLYTTDIK
jgi:hypothetical protein